MPKKKFIDKKNSVTFHLVHRSQQDPLVADENAPQRVLVPATAKKTSSELVEERHKFGIYFDDDYNYLQHLKPTNSDLEWVPTEKQTKEKVKEHKLRLPSSVFASEQEEDVGMLNRAAPQPNLRLDLDVDVVAAMDDDFDYSDPDNQLEDNFIELANAEGETESEHDMDSNFGSEEMDEVASLDGQFTFRDEETKSRFTEYSMSSSVMKRNEELTLLDNRFEKMYEQYDENEIGALDCDEIEGYMPETANVLLQYAEEFQKDCELQKLDENKCKQKTLELNEDSDENDDDFENREVPTKMKWDCESILSTHSNIYNHPKLIREPNNNKIKIDPRTGIPTNVLGCNKLTVKALSRLNAENDDNISISTKTISSHISELYIRPKDESPIERHNRKMLLKSYRKERRIEKKANSDAFKEEALRQCKNDINNKNNFVGNKIL